MSMIMRVARGTAQDLERLAEDGGDDGSAASLSGSVLSAQLAAIGSLPPEIRARLVATLGSHPQAGAMPPGVIEGLRRGFTIVPPSSEPAANGGGGGQQPGTAAARPATLDIHKSWHIFHYLFTGGAGGGGTAPANFLMEGGHEVGEDQGYGPGRLLDATETAAFARFMQGLTVADLTRRLDGPRMAELHIYCAGEGSGADVDEMTDDVESYFPRLQAYFQAAAQAGESTLVWLT